MKGYALVCARKIIDVVVTEKGTDDISPFKPTLKLLGLYIGRTRPLTKGT